MVIIKIISPSDDYLNDTLGAIKTGTYSANKTKQQTKLTEMMIVSI